MRILVAGGAVAALDDLSTGQREFIHRDARLFEADITDRDAVEACLTEWKPEVVDHHAAHIDVRHLLPRLDYTVLRYPSVYGPRQNPHGEEGVNAIFIGLMLHGKRPPIFGTGEQLRDYVYVGDVVEANVLALERGSGETVNIGSGVGVSVNQIFRELKSLLGFEGEPIHEAPRAGEVHRIYLDAARAERVLGWRPRTPFRDGLAKTIAWSRAAGI